MTSEVPAAVLAPQVEIPREWIHPDLKRLREEYRPMKAVEEIADITRAEAQGAALSKKVGQLMAAHEQQKSQLETLLKQVEALQQSVTATEASTGKWLRIDRSWKDQIIFHKTVASSRKRLDDLPPPPAKDFVASRVLGFIDQWAPLSIRALLKPPEDDATFFLKVRAPSMRIDKDGRLEWPTFSDEPCVLCGTSVPSCGNPLCVYSHPDQVRHIVQCIFHLLEHLEVFRGKGKICAAGEIADRTLASYFSGAMTQSERRALIALHTLASTIITLRLHKIPTAASVSMHPLSKVSLEDSLKNWLSWLSLGGSSVFNPQEKALVDGLKQARTLEAMQQICIKDIRGSPSSFAWRVLMAVQQARGVTRVGYLWLSSKGIQLFPTCPEMHRLHLAAAADDPSISEEECLQIFYRSSDIVSGQVIADGLNTNRDKKDPPLGLGASSALIATALTKLSSVEALHAFVSKVTENPGSYGCSVHMQYNLHIILAAAHFSQSTSFLRETDVASPSTLPHRALTIQPYASLLPATSYSDHVHATFTRLSKLLERLKDFADENTLRCLTNCLRISLMRSHATDAGVILQSVQSFDPDLHGSHMTIWNEFLACTLATEGVHAAVEACRGIDATGNIVLRLLAARFLASIAGYWGEGKEMIVNAVTAFRREHRIERDGVLLLAGDAGAPSRFNLTISQWISFLIAFAGTCSARDGIDVIRAIPRRLLNDITVRSTYRWMAAVDIAINLVTLDSLSEFTAGCREVLGQWVSERLEDWVSVRGVTDAHILTLEIYRAIPTVEVRAERIAALRLALLEVAALLGCVHPLLRESSL